MKGCVRMNGGALGHFEHIAVAIDDTVATVRLARADRRNALSRALMGELTAAARALRDRTDVHAVIVTGAAEFFSAGADLKEPAPEGTLLERRQAMRAGPDLCAAWEALEQVTIAAIEGYCIGGAVALALACDFRIMGEGGHLRLPEIPLGINMSWQTLPRLAALVGPARAKRFTIFGEALGAPDAEHWGMIDQCVPDGTAEDAARVWARAAAALPPLPVRMAKQAIQQAAVPLGTATSFMDRDQFMLTSQTEDFREGTHAFMERRPPRFTGN